MTTAGMLALTGAGALTAAVSQRLVVPRLPEPPRVAGPWVKPPYAALGTATPVAAAALAGGLSALVAATRPTWQWPLLVLPAGPLASLVVVDALTTYLPRKLDRACWTLALAGCLGAALLAPAPGELAVRWLVASVLTALFFWSVWRASHALGWGDVRLAPLLALGPATQSWQACLHFLFLGTLAGALWGLATAAWRHRNPHPLGTTFPYGPGLWVGSCIAVLIG